MDEYLEKAITSRPRGIEAEAVLVGFVAAVLELAAGGESPEFITRFLDRAEEYCDQGLATVIEG